MPKIVASFFLHGQRKFFKAFEVSMCSELFRFIEGTLIDDVDFVAFTMLASEDKQDNAVGAFLGNYKHYDGVMLSGRAE